MIKTEEIEKSQVWVIYDYYHNKLRECVSNPSMERLHTLEKFYNDIREESIFLFPLTGLVLTPNITGADIKRIARKSVNGLINNMFDTYLQAIYKKGDIK